ncbi:MAG: bifunctional (p)ppGpp synthetase/guanosine-3',5'-bis(diphosphate) 3'-pyrophosphohydrolase [Spirochaetes bacterium]|nr:bifunctional (p)ppGpp synthetase/guanosine-3',5'-bis(diphosphate) 3'-pyrophosphohydrolase [Spirochaetota bacterium]
MSPIDLKIKSRDLDTLIAVINENNPEINIENIRKAYEIASEAHKDQQRLSGEPYIVHPMEVAIILANLKMDETTIIAALLHDVVEDTPINLQKIKELFGEEIATLVDGVTKISSLKKQTKQKEQAETLRKMLLATIHDARVIIIKLADKLHNMRTIMFQPEHKQKYIAQEVLDIYAPLAGRLGMSKIRSELEDLAFKILHPEEYKEIIEHIKARRSELEAFIESIRHILEQRLKELNIEAQIQGRIKHHYSIFKKLQQGRTFDDIFDLRAIRIITNEVKDCYGILGIVHTIWTPIPSRFKDYIAVPKSNMYQSLHTTVIGPDGHPLEIQIRTWDMHATAEMGIAAHWLYKEGLKSFKPKYKNITILNNINEWQNEIKDTREFIKELKMDLYEDEIFVFTPKGKIIKLAKGSTPVDFAYLIHTEIGNHCIGAKVNNQLVPLKTELKSGDIVEILTSKKGHPSPAWLKFVKSSNARYKIRNWLRKNAEGEEEHSEKEEKHEKQKEKREKVASVSIPENELVKIKSYTNKKKVGITIDGTNNVMIRLSQCCQPIPGDDVVGFITRGRGITVHKKNCPALQRLQNESERFVDIQWEQSESTYPVKIAVEAIDRTNLLKDVADEISLTKTNIIRAEASVVAKDQAILKFVLEVKSISHLNEILKRLKQIKNVTRVYKLNEKVILK